MASGTEPKPYVSLVNVTSDITLSSEQGTFSGYSAIKTGCLIVISFVFTPSVNIPANTVIVISPTYSRDSLKPYQRSQIGGCNKAHTTVLANTDGYFVAMPDTISSGEPFWISLMYMCSE